MCAHNFIVLFYAHNSIIPDSQYVPMRKRGELYSTQSILTALFIT